MKHLPLKLVVTMTLIHSFQIHNFISELTSSINELLASNTNEIQRMSSGCKSSLVLMETPLSLSLSLSRFASQKNADFQSLFSGGYRIGSDLG